jgi:hypothetical protein
LTHCKYKEQPQLNTTVSPFTHKNNTEEKEEESVASIKKKQGEQRICQNHFTRPTLSSSG